MSEVLKVEEVFMNKNLTVSEIDSMRKDAATTDASRKKINSFFDQLDDKLTKTAAAVRRCTGRWICGRYDDTLLGDIEKVSGDSVEYYYVYACLLAENGFYVKAVKTLTAAVKVADKEDKDALKSLLAECYLKAGMIEEARAEIENGKKGQLSADHHYLNGFYAEKTGYFEASKDAYEKALKVDPKHLKAKFRLAYCHDLNGDDETAVALYEDLISSEIAHEGALVNLGILYEDRGEYPKAKKMFARVAELNPFNSRAKMFLSDVEASMNMYYDEEAKKRESRKLALLNTPISELKTSARSRNCLHKLKVFTLGDLVQKTEQQLRSCSNMGESSLLEIQELLRQKDLTLVEDEDSAGGTPESANNPIYDLGLSPRCLKALSQLELTTIGDLIRKTEKDLLGCKNFGLISLEEVKQKLAQSGLSLARE